MLKVEFHCHTLYSKDSLVSLQALHGVALRERLDRIVITDHNAIRGAVKAHDLDPVHFIIGEEIMTCQGELLGIFMQELIPPGLTARETIRLLRDQGAFITVAHPFDTLRAGHWKVPDLLDIIDSVDAIEVFNSRSMRPLANKLARDFARDHNLLTTVGSDAHSTSELGTATLSLPVFSDTPTLRQALSSAQPLTRSSPPWVHLYSRYAALSRRFT